MKVQVLSSERIRGGVALLVLALLWGGTATAQAHTATAESDISIRYEQGTFSGRVSSSLAGCEAGRRVDLYEVREGEDRLAGSTVTDDQGRWSISLTVGDGMFYAVAPATSDSSYLHFHQCGRADSDTVVIEGGEQVAVLGARQTPFRDAASGGPEQVEGLRAGEAAAGEGVPFTGADIAAWVLAGVAAISVGAIVLLLHRRRAGPVTPAAPRAPLPLTPPPPPGLGHTPAKVLPLPPERATRLYDDRTGQGIGGGTQNLSRNDYPGIGMHPIVDQAHPPELRDYLGVVATRKWSVMLITLAVTAAALAYSARQTPVYQAEARVHVRSVPIGEYQAETSQTETQLVASEQVAERVGEDLGVDPGEALGGLQVTAVEDSRVLGMYYTSEDPDFAARAANSFAHHYIELRQEQAMDALVAEQRDAERRIRDVETALADVLGEMADARDADDSSRLDALQAEQLSLSSRLGVLRQHLDILASQRSLQLGMGEVIRQAEPPGSPYSPDLVTNGLLGLLFGLGLGIATVFLRQKLDSRFAARAEVESALGAPILATISKFKLTKKEPWDLVMLAQPRSAASEAYRGLRTNLQVLLDRLGSKSLLVTSPSAGEGKTITAANLAVAFAQSGRRVALVSADLRRPRVESYLRVANNGRGLSWWLSGREDVAPSMSPTPVPNLEVLTSGTIPGSPAELLTSPRLGRLVEHLKQSYDLVIFDSAPLLPVADSVGLSFQLDATLMVLNAATTHRASTEHARAKVERVGGRLLGAVLNAYDPTLPYYIHERDYYYDAEAFASAPAASNGRGRHATPSGRRGLFSRR